MNILFSSLTAQFRSPFLFARTPKSTYQLISPPPELQPPSVPSVCCCCADIPHACILSRVQLFVTSWTVARQAPLSMDFPRQDYWSGLPFPHPRDLPNPRIEPASPASPALAGRFLTTEPPRKPALATFLNSISILSLPFSEMSWIPQITLLPPTSKLTLHTPFCLGTLSCLLLGLFKPSPALRAQFKHPFFLVSPFSDPTTQ